MAPIASAVKHLPQGICRQASCGLWSADCEARYGGMAPRKRSKFEIAASAFGGLAMTNETARDLCRFGAYAD